GSPGDFHAHRALAVSRKSLLYAPGVNLKKRVSIARRDKNRKEIVMAQDFTANFFTFSDHSGTIQINYYPHAPGPIVQGQSSGGPRLEYKGSEGHFVFPSGGAGRENINVQEESVLGPHVNVVLVPTIDAKAVSLTLLLPPINMAGQEKVDFHTIAIKTTSYGMLPKEGARLTYEVLHLRGKAQHIILPLTAQP